MSATGLSLTNKGGKWQCGNVFSKQVEIESIVRPEKFIGIYEPRDKTSFHWTNDEIIKFFGVDPRTSSKIIELDSTSSVKPEIFTMTGTKPVCVGSDANSCTAVDNPRYYIQRFKMFGEPFYEGSSTILAVQSSDEAQLVKSDFATRENLTDVKVINNNANKAFFCRASDGYKRKDNYVSFTEKYVAPAAISFGNTTFNGFGSWTGLNK